MLTFQVMPQDAAAIQRIAARAVKLAPEFGLEMDETDVQMDLTACHANGCALDLPKLERARDVDLMHDVCGIDRHLNRGTGELSRNFVPRCALPEEATSGARG